MTTDPEEDAYMTNCNFNDTVTSTNGVKGAFLDQAIQLVLCKSIHTGACIDSYSHFKMIEEGVV